MSPTVDRRSFLKRGAAGALSVAFVAWLTHTVDDHAPRPPAARVPVAERVVSPGTTGNAGSMPALSSGPHAPVTVSSRWRRPRASSSVVRTGQRSDDAPHRTLQGR